MRHFYPIITGVGFMIVVVMLLTGAGVYAIVKLAPRANDLSTSNPSLAEASSGTQVEYYRDEAHKVSCWILHNKGSVATGISCLPDLPEEKPQPITQSLENEAPVYGYAYTLNEPQIELPLEMLWDAGRVWTQCEVITEVMTFGGRPDLAKGLQGELGHGQIHPIHFDTMRRLGLNPYIERDRLTFARDHLWAPTKDWRHWSCGYMATGGGPDFGTH